MILHIYIGVWKHYACIYHLFLPFAAIFSWMVLCIIMCYVQLMHSGKTSLMSKHDPLEKHQLLGSETVHEHSYIFSAQHAIDEKKIYM